MAKNQNRPVFTQHLPNIHPTSPWEVFDSRCWARLPQNREICRFHPTFTQHPKVLGLPFTQHLPNIRGSWPSILQSLSAGVLSSVASERRRSTKEGAFERSCPSCRSCPKTAKNRNRSI